MYGYIKPIQTLKSVLVSAVKRDCNAMKGYTILASQPHCYDN